MNREKEVQMRTSEELFNESSELRTKIEAAMRLYILPTGSSRSILKHETPMEETEHLYDTDSDMEETERLYDTDSEEDGLEDKADEELQELEEELEVDEPDREKSLKAGQHSAIEDDEESIDVDEECNLMVSLFDFWDLNHSGRIDRNELLSGVRGYCQARNLSNSDGDEMKGSALRLFEAADVQKVGSLDKQQFVLFIFDFSHEVRVSVKDIVLKMMESLGEERVDGWSLMPTLFDTLDVDQDGSLNREEILLGLKIYCNSRRIFGKDQEILDIYAECEQSPNHNLDVREFSVFMSRFAIMIHESMEDVAKFIMEHPFYIKARQKREEKEQELRNDTRSPQTLAASMGTLSLRSGSAKSA